MISQEELDMYNEHYAHTCVAIAVAANKSPSSIAIIARNLNKVLNLGILK